MTYYDTTMTYFVTLLLQSEVTLMLLPNTNITHLLTKMLLWKHIVKTLKESIKHII